MATRKLTVTYMAYIIFLLGGTALDFPLWGQLFLDRSKKATMP